MLSPINRTNVKNYYTIPLSPENTVVNPVLQKSFYNVSSPVKSVNLQTNRFFPIQQSLYNIRNYADYVVVSSLAATIDAKDTYTKGHSAAVSRYAEALARAIDLPANEVERIKLGALLHDIGKIGIPEHVLRKPEMLSDDEWAIMKQHPAIGADKVLKPNKSLHDLIPMVKYHHEHIDGSGYPYGLKGDDIPLSARIVAIADSYHALISDRPYRKGLSVQKACEILKMGAGTQWDRELVRRFIIIAPSLATNI